MKIHLFHPETGVYLGEDFADEAPSGRGVRAISTDATVIPPPPVAPGQVPVFNRDAQRWELRQSPVVEVCII